MASELKSLLYSRHSTQAAELSVAQRSKRSGVAANDFRAKDTNDSATLEDYMSTFGISATEVNRSKVFGVTGLPSGETALHVAARLGRCDVVTYLLAEKTEAVNAADSAGYTPLHSALEHRCLDAARLLLLAGANVNAITNIGNTPLHHATRCIDGDMVQLLLDRGAEVNWKNFVGRTPLHHATWHGNITAIRQICDCGADIRAQDDYGNTAFYMIDNMKAQVAATLVDYGATVDAQNSSGQTPLHLACVRFKETAVNSLLDVGANCNVCDAFGVTPLHYAVHDQTQNMPDAVNFQEIIVTKLVDHGANSKARSNVTGRTALHMACMNPEISNEVIKLLVKRSLNSLLSDYQGNNYMHYYATYRGLFKVTAPLSPRCVLYLTNNCFQTVLHMNAAEARKDWQQPVFCDLHNHTDKLKRTCMHSFLASGAGYLGDCYQFLTPRTDFAGRNCLHYACISKPPQTELKQGMSRSWIDSTELINAQDAYGRTPLFYAALYQDLCFDPALCQELALNAALPAPHQYPGFISELILSGADAKIADVDGVLPEDISMALYAPTDDYHPLAGRARVIILDRDKRLYFKLKSLTEGSIDCSDARRKVFEEWNEIQNMQHDQGYRTSLLRKVKDFVSKLTSEIGKLDSVFESEPMLVGSGREGTRAKADDEFDFMLILKRFKPLVDFTAQHAQFPGFFRLKTTSANAKEFQQMCDANGIVQPLFVKERLYTLVIEACNCPCVWDDSAFEYLKIRIQNGKYSPAVTIELPLNRLVADNRSYFYFNRSTAVSIDLVPAVQTEMYVSAETPFGRYASERYPASDPRAFVVIKPHKITLGNDVNGFCPYTFILLESDVISGSPAAVKAAYMMLKHFLFGPWGGKTSFVNKYALKQCVLQCLVTDSFSADYLSDPVTAENLTGCISVIFQQLWQYVLKDKAVSAVHNKPLAVWQFEPFVGFLRVLFRLHGIPYSMDLPNLHENVSGANPKQTEPCDIQIKETRLTSDKMIAITEKFRLSCERLKHIRSMLYVPISEAESETVSEVQDVDSKLVRYALKFDDCVNELYVKETNRATMSASPYIIDCDVTWTSRQKFSSPTIGAAIKSLYDVHAD